MPLWLVLAAAVSAAAPSPPVVSMGEYIVARSPETASIETVGVATCIAVFLYDPASKVGSLGHFSATSDASRSISVMKRAMTAAGASPRRLRATLIGGWDTSTVRDMAGFTSTSPELLARLKHALAGVPIVREDTLAVPFSGKPSIRNLEMDLATGEVTDFSPGGPVVPSNDASDPAAPPRPLRRHPLSL